MVTNGIFTQEIEFDDVFFAIFFLVQRDVLYAEGAATDLDDSRMIFVEDKRLRPHYGPEQIGIKT